MPKKRIIACLDMAQGRVVKGVQFENLVDAGDPAETARAYCRAGVDELVLLDINASIEHRKTLLDVVHAVAEVCSVPLSVGGGISSIEDIRAILKAGADKISISSAAVNNPELIAQASREFGSEAVIVAIDAQLISGGEYRVVTGGGRTVTALEPTAWAKRCENLGAGALLVTAKHCDGVKQGYDNVLNKRIVETVGIPVIASGGAGNMQHFADAFAVGVDACLAASLFHFGDVNVAELKAFLRKSGFDMRD